ncbi:MAG: hypothetical protein ACRDTJ_30275 [Pseudonocardiaceae bacterium]
MARVRRKRSAPPALPSEITAPPELLDADATVWHDQRAYHRFMAAHGWTLPPAERMGCTTAPANRRGAAAAGWAVTTGTATRAYGDGAQPHADFHRLRELGLCD